MGRLQEMMEEGRTNRRTAKILYEANKRGRPGKKVVNAEARRQEEQTFQERFKAEQVGRALTLLSDKQIFYKHYGEEGMEVLERLSNIVERGMS